MAHSDKKQTDFNQRPDSGNRQRIIALSQDIEDVNSGLRIDFDQKLAELTELLGRFKALLGAPSQEAAQNASNDSNAIAISSTSNPLSGHIDHKEVPDNNIASINSAAIPLEPTKDKPETANPEADSPVTPATTGTQISVAGTSTAKSRYAPEPARFETGLYKLNCQLYRFRLELDQEMEFREEPLHIHFQQESELSVVLQKLGDKSSEINPDN